MHILMERRDENNPLKWDKIDAAFYILPGMVLEEFSVL